MSKSDRAAFKKHARRNYTMYKNAKRAGNRKKAAYHAANYRASKRHYGGTLKSLFR